MNEEMNTLTGGRDMTLFGKPKRSDKRGLGGRVG
jgi:hypothetical protein